jgi:plasmid stabilization system protein ParE
MNLSWTPTARMTYFNVLDFLFENWTKNEIESFVHETERVLKEIIENPYMFKVSRNKRSIRKGLITKHNSLYYRVRPRKEEIELLTFWDNRQNPNRIKY